MFELEGRRIALIGGAGFIGHHMALAMVTHGATVEVIDSLAVNHVAHVASLSPKDPNRNFYLSMLSERLTLLDDAGVPLRRQDARDRHGLCQRLSDFEPDTVVHLAAVAHASRSNEDPYTAFDHSMTTLANALEWARSANLRRFVYFSSSMVYGDFRTPTVSEDHPLEPRGVYGAHKLGGEKLVISYGQVFHLNYTIVRPMALYGPRCVSRRVSQAFIERAFAGQPLVVEGDGRERVGFTHVDDVVAGVMCCITHEGALGQIFNMTSGHACTLRELATLVQGHFPGTEVTYGPRDETRPYRGALSMDKARELIGHVAVVSLEEGIGRTVEWYRAFANAHPLSGC